MLPLGHLRSTTYDFSTAKKMCRNIKQFPNIVFKRGSRIVSHLIRSLPTCWVARMSFFKCSCVLFLSLFFFRDFQPWSPSWLFPQTRKTNSHIPSWPLSHCTHGSMLQGALAATSLDHWCNFIKELSGTSGKGLGGGIRLRSHSLVYFWNGQLQRLTSGQTNGTKLFTSKYQADINECPTT